MSAEEWRVISTAPDYEVSSLGRVRRITTSQGTYAGRMIAVRPNQRGYPTVRLREDGRVKFRSVHRLVATAFLDNPDGHPLVRHLDGNKENNSSRNLAWGTTEENIADRDIHGTTCRGSRHHSSKLSLEDVQRIRLAERTPESNKTLAKEYGVTDAAIRHIWNRRNWKHVH